MTDDAQDQAEQLDEDKITDDQDRLGDQVGDAFSQYPPDQPLGVNSVGVTPVEEDAGESFAERTWREEPEPAADGLDPVGVDQPVGELVEPDASTLDGEEQELGELVDATESGPEEAAIHVLPDDEI